VSTSLPLLLLVATSSVSTSSTSDLEAELAAALGSDPQPAAPAPSGAPSSVRFIDIALDLLGAAGLSTEKEATIRDLEGGGHDPKNRGFTIQNVELTLAGIVDPYLRGDANIVLQIDFGGETVIELEEAYLTSLALPFNLQLKAGQFFTAFGRLNPAHPHTWDFVDQPVVNSRFMGGDGLRSQGVQLSWLTPLPFFLELTGSVQNSQGETAVSFRNAAGETIAGRELIERDVDHPGDLLYLGRLKSSFDFGEETTVVLGASGAFGPNATALDTNTMILGADLYVKWKPLTNEVGWPYFALQAEVLMRRYDVPDPAVLTDYGLYAQALWGFVRPWVVGVRYDFARGQDVAFDDYTTSSDPLRDERHRASAVLTYYPSEFSKLRLQYAYDRADFLPDGDAHSVYLQAEIIFGAHGAHKF